MRGLIIIFMGSVLVFASICNAQPPNPYTNLNGNVNYFELVVECPVRACTLAGAITDTCYQTAPAHSKFVLIDITFDKCIIRFEVFAKNKALQRQLNYEDDNLMDYKYFVITKGQFDFKTRQIFRQGVSFAMGTVVIPVKFRTGPFDFAKDITLGTTLGPKFLVNSNKNISVDLLMGLGVSSNTLDSLNTHGKVSQPTDILAFSPTLSVMLEFGSAQLGLIGGFDFPSQAVKENDGWVNANKPWFSIALGYSIFATGTRKF